MRATFILLIMFFANYHGASQSWQVISRIPGIGILSGISFADSLFGMTINSNGNNPPTVYKTEDGGETWAPSLELDSLYYGALTSIEVYSRNYALAGAYIGRIYKYDGTAWHLVYAEPGMTVNDFYLSDDQTGYAVGMEGLMLRTTDGGETWDHLAQVTYKDLDGIDGSGPLNLTVIANVVWPRETSGNRTTDPWWGYILSSHNGGLTWSAQEYTNHTIHGISMINDSTAYFCGAYYPGGGMSSNPFIWKTDNNVISMNWSYSYYYPCFTSIDFAGQEHGVVVGCDGYITRYYSGEWHEEISPTTFDLHAVFVLEDTLRSRDGIMRQIYAWAAGDSGTVLKFDETIVGQQEPPDKQDPAFIYPNPVETKANLRIPNGGNQYVLTISDLKGRVLKAVDAGSQTLSELDLGFLVPGVYIARLTTSERILTQKIIKIR